MQRLSSLLASLLLAALSARGGVAVIPGTDAFSAMRPVFYAIGPWSEHR
jgi:hypothetical protein